MRQIAVGGYQVSYMNSVPVHTFHASPKRTYCPRIEKTMSLLSSALNISCNDARTAKIISIIGLDAPGGYAIREPDGRIMVWASEKDSVDDAGANAIFRSAYPESNAVWDTIAALAWIDETEQM